MMAKLGDLLIDISFDSGTLLLELACLQSIANWIDKGVMMAKPPESQKTIPPVAGEAQWLLDNIGLLDGGDKSFATSLAQKWVKYGKLSTLQIQWFWTMYDRAKKMSPGGSDYDGDTIGAKEHLNGGISIGTPTIMGMDMAANVSPPNYDSFKEQQQAAITAAFKIPLVAPQADVGDFHGVVNLFLKAKEHLKFPKINLQLPTLATILNNDGVPVNDPPIFKPLVLSLLGEKSQHPGSVAVTNGKKKSGYWSSGGYQYYGYVTPEGTWMPNPKMNLNDASGVQKLLSELAKDPIKVAKEHGKLSGKCCFCNKALTDEKSTAAGYGPVCAKHFHLEESYKSGKSFFESLKTMDITSKVTLDISDLEGITTEPVVTTNFGKTPFTYNYDAVMQSAIDAQAAKATAKVDSGELGFGFNFSEKQDYITGTVIEKDLNSMTIKVVLDPPNTFPTKAGEPIVHAYSYEALVGMGINPNLLKQGSKFQIKLGFVAAPGGQYYKSNGTITPLQEHQAWLQKHYEKMAKEQDMAKAEVDASLLIPGWTKEVKIREAVLSVQPKPKKRYLF